MTPFTVGFIHPHVDSSIESQTLTRTEPPTLDPKPKPYTLTPTSLQRLCIDKDRRELDDLMPELPAKRRISP